MAVVVKWKAISSWLSLVFYYIYGYNSFTSLKNRPEQVEMAVSFPHSVISVRIENSIDKNTQWRNCGGGEEM